MTGKEQSECSLCNNPHINRLFPTPGTSDRRLRELKSFQRYPDRLTDLKIYLAVCNGGCKEKPEQVSATTAAIMTDNLVAAIRLNGFRRKNKSIYAPPQILDQVTVFATANNMAETQPPQSGTWKKQSHTIEKIAVTSDRDRCGFLGDSQIHVKPSQFLLNVCKKSSQFYFRHFILPVALRPVSPIQDNLKILHSSFTCLTL